IRDEQMAASTHAPYADAHQARLNNVHVNGHHYSSWIAQTHDTNQWLKIDLVNVTKVACVATQGSQEFQDWVTGYTIGYSMDGTAWTVYQEEGVDKIFNGNNDNNTVKTNCLKRAVLMRYIKIMVASFHNKIALRVELYGKVQD
ncbi:predicted protein, partial [Nematostella vectensis]